MGADVDGVYRNMYTAFWTKILDSATEASNVRPEFQEEEWKSFGKILAKGLKDNGYMFSRLTKASTAAVTFFEHSISPDL